jgi:hypothetical protein
MQIACYNLPQFPVAIVGIQFKAIGKSGKESTFFWTPPYKSYPDTTWIWHVCSLKRQSGWKRLSKPLPQKRRDELQKFWDSQTDVGLWIWQLKRDRYFHQKLA